MPVVAKRNYRFKVDPKTHTYKFWINRFPGWEEETFEIFDFYLKKDKSFLDIGAWIGTTCLYGSLQSKDVVCIEADPVSLRDLRMNIAINNFTNIQICDKVISNNKNSVYFGPLTPEAKMGMSSTRIKLVKNNTSDIEVFPTTYNEILTKYFNGNAKDISLIKIDIEGGEENIIDDVFNSLVGIDPRPSVYLSFHYDWWNNKNLKERLDVFRIHKYCYFLKNKINIDDIPDIIEKTPFGTILFTDIPLE